jgi:hypothetical protein
VTDKRLAELDAWKAGKDEPEWVSEADQAGAVMRDWEALLRLAGDQASVEKEFVTAAGGKLVEAYQAAVAKEEEIIRGMIASAGDMAARRLAERKRGLAGQIRGSVHSALYSARDQGSVLERLDELAAAGKLAETDVMARCDRIKKALAAADDALATAVAGSDLVGVVRAGGARQIAMRSLQGLHEEAQTLAEYAEFREEIGAKAKDAAVAPLLKEFDAKCRAWQEAAAARQAAEKARVECMTEEELARVRAQIADEKASLLSQRVESASTGVYDAMQKVREKAGSIMDEGEE